MKIEAKSLFIQNFKKGFFLVSQRDSHSKIQKAEDERMVDSLEQEANGLPECHGKE